jgi:hypothetical protein
MQRSLRRGGGDLIAGAVHERPGNLRPGTRRAATRLTSKGPHKIPQYRVGRLAIRLRRVGHAVRWPSSSSQLR